MQKEKWHIKKKKKKKGYLKIHVAVNIKTKEILAFLEVTDHGKVMPRLIEHILKRKDNKGQKEFHRLAKKQ